jgi:hypothetical protein
MGHGCGAVSHPFRKKRKKGWGKVAVFYGRINRSNERTPIKSTEQSSEE